MLQDCFRNFPQRVLVKYQLDAVKGFDELMEASSSIVPPYLRRKAPKRRQPLSDEGMLVMLKEIKKRFSGEKAKALHEERMRRLGIVEAPRKGG